MYDMYAIVFQNETTGKVGMDKFNGPTEGSARRDFRDCYRHENYRILSVVGIPKVANSIERR